MVRRSGSGTAAPYGRSKRDRTVRYGGKNGPAAAWLTGWGRARADCPSRPPARSSWTALRPLAGEDVPLDGARGRILAEAVTSQADVPPFASSAMDGFAIPSGASGELTIAGESRAGHPFDGTVEPGTAVRISTGAVVPEGTGAVVQVELAEEGDGVVARPGARGRHQHPRRGRGHPHGRHRARRPAPCWARRRWACWPASATPRRAARSTPAGGAADHRRRADRRRAARCRPGGIYSSNGPALAALVQDAGGRVVLAEDVPDTAEGTRAALGRALEAADVVCVSGGVSVGPHDHVKGAFADLGVAGAVLARGAEARQADVVRHRRREAGLRPAGQPGVGDGHLPAVRAPRAAGAAGRRPRHRPDHGPADRARHARSPAGPTPCAACCAPAPRAGS